MCSWPWPTSRRVEQQEIHSGDGDHQCRGPSVPGPGFRTHGRTILSRTVFSGLLLVGWGHATSTGQWVVRGSEECHFWAGALLPMGDAPKLYPCHSGVSQLLAAFSVWVPELLQQTESPCCATVGDSAWERSKPPVFEAQVLFLVFPTA